MEDNIRIPVIDTLYSKGRHHNIIIICVGHAVIDLITKESENTPAIYITSNSSQVFFNRIQEKFNINANLYRCNQYQYEVMKDFISDYYIELDKDKNVKYNS